MDRKVNEVMLIYVLILVYFADIRQKHNCMDSMEWLCSHSSLYGFRFNSIP